MIYFEKDFLKFFMDLAANNNRDWFHASKKRYETVVKEPFKIFVNDLITEIKKDDSSISIEAKDSIFRINRDIRFSKDKSPYKLHMGAVISPRGRKEKSIPGIYIEITPERLGVFGGAWGPDKNQLQKIREGIVNNMDSFNKLIADKEFIKHFPDGIQGDKNKRLPKEFTEPASKQELIFNKQFFYKAELDPEVIFQDNLIETIMEYYFASKKIKNFLANSISN